MNQVMSELENNLFSTSENADVPISLEQIALLTDFPEDFIKKELLLEGVEEISLKEFRAKVLEYLEKTIDLVK